MIYLFLISVLESVVLVRELISIYKELKKHKINNAHKINQQSKTQLLVDTSFDFKYITYSKIIIHRTQHMSDNLYQKVHLASIFR